MNLSELKDLDLSDLDLENVGAWPPVIKGLAVIILMGLVLAGGYYMDTADMIKRWEREEAKEQDLRDQFERQQKVVANLPAYRAQVTEMERALDGMLRQLPTRTEMPDLLEDISNSGRINGLVFERFKPEREIPKEFYAEQPISIRAKGTYHQFGAFLSGVSALPRIVTVGSIRVEEASQPSGEDAELANTENLLVMESTLRTYRYVDEAEAPPEGGQ